MVRCVRAAGLFCALFGYIFASILWWYVCSGRVRRADQAGRGVGTKYARLALRFCRMYLSDIFVSRRCARVLVAKVKEALEY